MPASVLNTLNTSNTFIFFSHLTRGGRSGGGALRNGNYRIGRSDHEGMQMLDTRRCIEVFQQPGRAEKGESASGKLPPPDSVPRTRTAVAALACPDRRTPRGSGGVRTAEVCAVELPGEEPYAGRVLFRIPVDGQLAVHPQIHGRKQPECLGQGQSGGDFLAA